MTKEKKSLAQCLNCSRPETVIPLVSLQYAGNQTWICTQCLPTLIHQPEQIVGKLTKREQATSTLQGT